MGKLGKTLLAALGIMALAACSADATDSSTGEAALVPAPVFDGDPANHATFGVDVSVWETPLAQSEMDCFWASGVRHVIVGTQDQGVTREQLAMAVSRGMTVDAYVYIYWNTDVASQVEEAFRRVQGFPIGRMWLDIEQNPGTLGSKTIITDIQQGLTACEAQGSVECGIYTGPGFWKSYAANTSNFRDVKLWWAEYDHQTSLSTWSTEQFGGWSNPVGKQWATKPLCGVGGADWDTIQVTATPTVIVDRSPPTDTGDVPAAPAGLFPSGAYAYKYDYAKIMSQTVPTATSYQLAVEHWNGKTWSAYYTWTNPNAFVKFVPAYSNALYHFRARAQNSHGWGAWSDWSSFVYGTYSGSIPGTTPSPAPTPTPTPTTTPTTNPAPTASVPGALTPDGGVLLTTPNVTLSCSGVTSATNYQFAIESQSASGYAPYYTYSTSAPSVTFYPATHGIGYRWRARAEVGGAFGDWSPYATFQFK